MKLRGVIALAWLAVSACSRTEVDPNATGIEIATTIDAADGITQLQLSGTTSGMPAFDPGAVPTQPRPLSGMQTAVVLLPEALDGTEILVRVDAFANDTLVHTGGGPITVAAKEVRRLEVELGPPAVCGDGVITAPFEQCDDNNTAAADGCSGDCQVEPGWSCVGMPSQCAPPSSHKEIVSYAFLAIANPGLKSDVIATINGTTISAVVPNGTNVAALVATFAMTGMTMRVGGATQVSGATPNDFSSPITYTVIADDNSVKTYTVTVTIAGNSAKDLTSFAFLAADNAALAADITAQINGTTITATVPNGTDVTALVATFDTTGASVNVAGTLQTSGMTANDFTSAVSYTVAAADTSTKTYNVTVTVAKSSAKELTAFQFLSAGNPSLAMDVTAQINGNAIAATVPAGTDVTALVATFTTTGASVMVGSTLQTSGTTPNDFTNAVTYTVIAADSSMQSYTVTVSVAAGSAKDITAFTFESADNPALAMDIDATISGTSITAVVPSGTNVTSLVATFATTGASVTVNGTMQASGITANNFTAPVSYVVTAADSSTKTYTVTVTVAASSAKDLTSFSFLSVDNPGLGRDVTGTISGTAIALTVPFGANVTSLVATFATTGMNVRVGGVAQTSGVTANDFSAPVQYVVTAADNSTKTYTVTVTVATASAKDITYYAFLSADNPSLTGDAVGTISGTSISVMLPAGADKTGLVATFSTTGKLIKVGTKPQVSGITSNNFTSPVMYTVTAQDNSTKVYTVTAN